MTEFREFMTSSGSEGCRCIDASSELESLSDRRCELPDGERGVVLGRPGRSCVSLSYGSNACLQHDLEHVSNCREGTGDAPLYCLQPWCYVDRTTCKRDSTEQIFASDQFPASELFYSYSTCGSSPDAWGEFKQSAGLLGVLGSVNLTSVIPRTSSGYWPLLFKGNKKEIKLEDEYYYDDSVPFVGFYIDYFAQLIKDTNGDINSISHTPTSRSSLLMHPDSTFTAAVQDVSNGLADVAVGPFWVTAERLKMTPFTIPFLYDKTMLVIPKPKSKMSSNIIVEFRKVFQPFTVGLWLLIIGVIFFVAFLSVCFSRTESISKLRHRGRRRRKKDIKTKGMIWLRLWIDSIIQNGIFFCSAGVEQDRGSGLPHKFLMFGFGFFILVTISAYVANLAAFLTRSSMASPPISKMEQVDREGKEICAHPALKAELQHEWGHAKWMFADGDFLSVLDAYVNTTCEVLAIGIQDTLMSVEFKDKMCELDLVFTDSVILEIPMAFPIKPELVAGVSHWMFEAQMYDGISIPNTQKGYIATNPELEPNCNIELSQIGQEESDDYTQINSMNMAFPLLFIFAFALVAIALQVMLVCNKKKGTNSSVSESIPAGGVAAVLGRVSTLEQRKGARRTKFNFGTRDAIMSRGVGAAFDEHDEDEEYENFCGFLAGGDIAASTARPDTVSREQGNVNPLFMGETSES